MTAYHRPATLADTLAKRVPVHHSGARRAPSVRTRTRASCTNQTPTGACRGFGSPQAAIATESLVNQATAQLGLGRWEIGRHDALGRGRAVHEAVCALRQPLLATATAGDEAVLALDGARLRLTDAGGGGRALDLASVTEDVEADATYHPPTTVRDAERQRKPSATGDFAAQSALATMVCTAKVDDVVASQDVSRAVNARLVLGKIHGGIANGLGLALMEELIPGGTEKPCRDLIQTAADMPPIRVHLIEDSEPEGPFRAKGEREPALVSIAPAILSAMRHAAGVTLRQVPVLPHGRRATMQESAP